jgi:hypothetical protein
MVHSAYEPLDAALEQLAGYGTELTNGNFNHAPMVAETLCALGRPDIVLPWLDRYRLRILPRGATNDPIGESDWRQALGTRDRFPDWAAFFALRLQDADWREVLDVWAKRLAPGMSAAATHGAIRVGHAVRALNVEETALRRQELADALAAWAASYSELPTAHANREKAPPATAITHVAIVPPEQRRPGNIVAALARLDDFPEFASVIGFADLDGDIATRLAELCDLFARVYLANVHNIPTAIAFIHGVTSLTALGHIVPNVSEATARSLLRFGWQAGCGLYACFGGDVPYRREVALDNTEPEALIERALANGDEHVIKFTEACLARHKIAPSPAYFAAIRHAFDIVRRR